MFHHHHEKRDRPGQQDADIPPPPPEYQQVQGSKYYNAPPEGPPRTQIAPATLAPDEGQFPGGEYRITHRNTNAVVTIDLQPGAAIRSIAGAMMHMSGSVQLSGKLGFSWKKFFTGAEIAESTYVGPGRVALAPRLMGDVFALPVGGAAPRWRVAKHAYMGCTNDIVRDVDSQGFGRGVGSESGIFVYQFTGQGLIWCKSFGAAERLDLAPGQEHIVENGHLAAWSCQYSLELAGGGFWQSTKTGEGLVCRFTGPGVVYMQTRNPVNFELYIQSVAGN